MSTSALTKNEAVELIHEAFKSVKLEIEDLKVNESYICTQYVIKSYNKLPGFRGLPAIRIESALPDFLYPHCYRLYINSCFELCIDLMSEKQLPPPALLPQLESDKFTDSPAKIPVPIGETMNGKLKIMDLSKAPHVLVAGATQQGKSEFLHSVIASLLHPKNQPCELILIGSNGSDFKDRYSSIVSKIYATADETLTALKSLLTTLDERYNMLASDASVKLPPIVVIIDEYADFIIAGESDSATKKQAKEIYKFIIGLAQKGRSIGIHLILATQRPSHNVITGLLKANFPTRIAFRVFSKADSRTILDTDGAETLFGHGDMLIQEGMHLERLQSFYCTETY